MDSTAISLCMDNRLPLIVFNLKEKGNFKRVVQEIPSEPWSPWKAAKGEADVDGAGSQTPGYRKMDHAIEHLKRDLAGIRTGRASVALLDGIKVDYYGTLTLLKQVANVATPEISASSRFNRGNRT